MLLVPRGPVATSDDVVVARPSGPPLLCVPYNRRLTSGIRHSSCLGELAVAACA
jgi:hypothetical protein